MWVYLLSSLYAVPVAPWVRALVVWRGRGGRPPEGEEEKEPFLGHVELAHPLPAPLLVEGATAGPEALLSAVSEGCEPFVAERRWPWALVASAPESQLRSPP